MTCPTNLIFGGKNEKENRVYIKNLKIFKAGKRQYEEHLPYYIYRLIICEKIKIYVHSIYRSICNNNEDNFKEK